MNSFIKIICGFLLAQQLIELPVAFADLPVNQPASVVARQLLTRADQDKTGRLNKSEVVRARTMLAEHLQLNWGNPHPLAQLALKELQQSIQVQEMDLDRSTFVDLNELTRFIEQLDQLRRQKLQALPPEAFQMPAPALVNQMPVPAAQAIVRKSKDDDDDDKEKKMPSDTHRDKPMSTASHQQLQRDQARQAEQARDAAQARQAAQAREAAQRDQAKRDQERERQSRQAAEHRASMQRSVDPGNQRSKSLPSSSGQSTQQRLGGVLKK